MFDTSLYETTYAVTIKSIVWPKAITHIFKLSLTIYHLWPTVHNPVLSPRIRIVVYAGLLNE